MKKRLYSFLLTAVILAGILPSAAAEVKDGYVTFSSKGKMVEENFNVDQVYDGLEPGDTRSYTVHIRNSYPNKTRWYMSNEVLKTLEENGISGGVYQYTLTYTGPNNRTTTLFPNTGSSGMIGNSEDGGRIGLEEATEDLEKFFFLDTLSTNEAGTVTLTVRLEGETQDNSYQNTVARIRMNFAAEIVNTGSSTRTRIVKTGDSSNLLPYYIGMSVAGLLFLYLALDAYTDRKYKRGRDRK